MCFRMYWAIGAVVFLAFTWNHVEAGVKGGRGGGAGGMSRPAGGMSRPAGGMSRPAGGMSRPATRPSLPSGRPNMPNLGSGKPMPNPNTQRPSINRPAVTQPAPITRPAPGNRPSLPNVNRPNSNLPNINSPITNRPNNNIPNINRPNLSKPPLGKPSIDLPSVNKPTTLPGMRPGTRPNLPGLGGGTGLDRPNVSLPTRPGTGNKPNFDFGNKPIARPKPGDLGDFLGLDRPVTLPGQIGNKPVTLPGNKLPTRPGEGDRPNISLPNRPGPGNRPGNNLPNRPNDRPSWPNFGDVNIGNTVINSRPSWVNIDNNRLNNINNRWQNQIGGLANWPNRFPDRMANWNRWGNGIRHQWWHHNHHHHWFGPNWWNNHHHGFCGWHYFHRFPYHNWAYWWTVPTYSTFTNWFTWTAPAQVWSQPVFYDYGSGGNVVYENNSVYVNGQQISTADEFAQSAASLATVPPPTHEDEAAEMEWMPLGTFAITTSEQDVEPTRVIQLAISKTGIVSGTLFNIKTDQAQSVQGQVDKNTQRVAFRVGESEEVVVETGLYNLTQNEAPALVHFGKDKVETYLLVRLEQPESPDEDEAANVK